MPNEDLNSIISFNWVGQLHNSIYEYVESNHPTTRSQVIELIIEGANLNNVEVNETVLSNIQLFVETEPVSRLSLMNTEFNSYLSNNLFSDFHLDIIKVQNFCNFEFIELNDYLIELNNLESEIENPEIKHFCQVARASATVSHDDDVSAVWWVTLDAGGFLIGWLGEVATEIDKNGKLDEANANSRLIGGAACGAAASTGGRVLP